MPEKTEVVDIEEIEKESGVESTEVIKMNGKRFEVAREQLPFDELMSRSEFLANSTLVPQQYQKRPENVLIALDLSSRMGLSPLIVMQNLYVIQGKPSWSGQACAMMVRNSKQFKDVQLHYTGKEKTANWGAYVTAVKRSNGAQVKCAKVTLGIAKAEGWYDKNGSKWKTTPELMLAYRAYAWFTMVHAPELLM